MTFVTQAQARRAQLVEGRAFIAWQKAMRVMDIAARAQLRAHTRWFEAHTHCIEMGV